MRLHQSDAVDVYNALSIGDKVRIYRTRAGFRPASWDHAGAGTRAGGRRSTRTTSGRTHTVRHGETLSGIASRYRVEVADIAEANSITDIHSIQAGQELVIPRTGEGRQSEVDED